MASFKSKLLRINCESNGCFVDGLTDWTDIIECFPRRIRPSDIDGVVELNDCFLFLEEKGIGVDLPLGQRIMLQRLSNRERISVLVFRNLDTSGIQVEVMVLEGGVIFPWQAMSRETFLGRVSNWVEMADARVG